MLFRLESRPRTGEILLLVQSQGAPDWTWMVAPEHRHLLLPLGDEPNPWVKRFDPKLRAGQVLQFRLQANPTVKRQGRRYGLYREEEQADWLRRKGERGGFRVVEMRITGQGMVEDDLTRDGAKHAVQLLSVQFDGLLQVSDATRLLDSIRQGVGSGKGLGFGLLSLAPALTMGGARGMCATRALKSLGGVPCATCTNCPSSATA
ncbi:MAG: type I-E CRISPR-associated protein Cas6/Cse3/CasE [Anaerolineae bacterium]|nr:type I-E CRISPR-associated protein Cas6/Cse3/CasE [Anaerolineae bacterium]